MTSAPPIPRPLGLLAELTYQCPLHCPYCSNPTAPAPRSSELTTAEWRDLFLAAHALGVVQTHLSGGEPLVRPDIVTLTRAARGAGLYVNLVTSGMGLTGTRLSALVDAGLDHVQLSVQAAEPALNDRIAGIRAFPAKMRAARLVTAAGLPLTINAVLHRANVAGVADLVALAVEMGAQRIELAHTQYYGWGLVNRAALMPTRAEAEAAEAAAVLARAEHGDRLEIVYVLPDYYEDYPKPCVPGWGRRQLVVAPNGDVLPCPAAAQIPGLGVENVRSRSLAEIWTSSPAFTRFRGTSWMPEPCASCPRQEIDFGGCRCQAFQLTGDAGRTDPVCSLSPDHGLIATALAGDAVGAAAAPVAPVARRNPPR